MSSGTPLAEISEFESVSDGVCDWLDPSYQILDFASSICSGFDIEDEGLTLDRMNGVMCHAYRILQTHVHIPAPSIFKRAAAFSVGFMLQSPLTKPFGVESVGSTVGTIKNHQNAVVAFEMARWSLENGKVITESCAEGPEEKLLKEPITTSVHFYTDLILSLASIPSNRGEQLTPGSAPHFHFLALLYESLMYCANPSASYKPRV
ncbi:MAG: hypothetical protein ACOYM3_18785 [Terrimicrobiaceae bacterium]